MKATCLNPARNAVIALTALAAMSLPALAENVNGRWIMADGKVTVAVEDCGANLCARIVGLKEPISKIDGKPKVDRENPEPALRKRPLIGLDILVDMKPAGAGKWKGAIYNADDGKTYSATLQHANSKIKLKACVAAVLCKTSEFVRAK